MCDSHDRRLQESAPKKNPALTPKPKRTRRHVSVSYPITLDSLCASNGVFGGAWNLETKSVTAEQNHAGHAKPLQTSRTSSSLRPLQRALVPLRGQPTYQPGNWVPPSPGSDRHDDAAPGPQAVIHRRLDLEVHSRLRRSHFLQHENLHHDASLEILCPFQLRLTAVRHTVFQDERNVDLSSASGRQRTRTL